MADGPAGKATNGPLNSVVMWQDPRGMIYKVKARIIEDNIGEFYRKLTDGTIAKQKPDGNESSRRCREPC